MANLTAASNCAFNLTDPPPLPCPFSSPSCLTLRLTRPVTAARKLCILASTMLSCTWRAQEPHQRKRRRLCDAGCARRGTFLLHALILAVVVQSAWAGRDLYEMLGVSRDADSATIKKAYRKLAIKYHPDKNPGDKSAEKMYKELNNAYEVLKDSGKRQRYDMTGQFEAGGDDEGDDDMWDPWSMFRGGRRQRRQEEKRVPDLVIPVAVDLELLYTGGSIDIAHKRQVICASWSDCETTCPHCKGSGVIITTRRLGPGFIQQVQTTCPHCGGTGKIVKGNCKSCPNGQFEKEEQMLALHIQPGTPDGHKITDGQTDELPDHAPGDVHFELFARPHKRFERKGNDLHYRQVISLREALIGVKRTVKQLDGRTVDIVSKGVTAPNDEIRIKGEGMPIYGGSGSEAGDLVVKFWVNFPRKLTDEQRALAAKMLGDATDGDADSSDEREEL